MTGTELTQVARSVRPGLPVLLASGYAESEGSIPASRAFKPFRKEELAASLGQLTAALVTAALVERAEIDRRLEDAEVAPAIALHPNLAEAYRRDVEKLTGALNAPEIEAGEARLALSVTSHAADDQQG